MGLAGGTGRAWERWEWGDQQMRQPKGSGGGKQDRRGHLRATKQAQRFALVHVFMLPLTVPRRFPRLRPSLPHTPSKTADQAPPPARAAQCCPSLDIAAPRCPAPSPPLYPLGQVELIQSESFGAPIPSAAAASGSSAAPTSARHHRRRPLTTTTTDRIPYKKLKTINRRRVTAGR